MEEKTRKYKVKAKYKQPFDTFGCVLWIIFLNVIGLIIAAFLCKEKYFIVIETNDAKGYSIKKIRVTEIEIYKVDINDIVIEEEVMKAYPQPIYKYGVLKGEKYENIELI